MSELKNLVQIIRDNPGAVAIVDNDGWELFKSDPELIDYEDREEWCERNRLADDGDVVSLGNGYGSGNCYGGDILQALAVIVGIQVKSV